MRSIVHDVRIFSNSECARRDVAASATNAHTLHMAKKQKTRQFLRAWRKHKGYTLERVAEFVGMTHQNLGKIERAEVMYNDELLERLAEFYQTDKGSLIMRDPAKLDASDAIWSLWESLTPPQRKEALEIIEVIKKRA
jgi:transcriptional regulator with XRE-family HTH domain